RHHHAVRRAPANPAHRHRQVLRGSDGPSHAHGSYLKTRNGQIERGDQFVGGLKGVKNRREAEIKNAIKGKNFDAQGKYDTKNGVLATRRKIVAGLLWRSAVPRKGGHTKGDLPCLT